MKVDEMSIKGRLRDKITEEMKYDYKSKRGNRG